MDIHKLEDWPAFKWNDAKISGLLGTVRHDQGRLLGRMDSLGFPLREEATLQTLTQDVVKTSEIEGERLDTEQVRSSIARRLGLDIGGILTTNRDVEGIVEVMLDATRQYNAPLTDERLFGWHAALFPTGRSGMSRIKVGAWRTKEGGEMQIVSGPAGHQRVHYEAPPYHRLESEMTRFLEWFNRNDGLDLVLKSGLAHFWFVSIHPFDDGNGRITRALADMTLARSEGIPQRFYSMSAQIQREYKAYYDVLEQSQRSTLDVTPWLEWFLGCLNRAIAASEESLEMVLVKARFWRAHMGEPFNDRQRYMINKLLGEFFGKLTSSKWALMTKCSPDTALRDITDLVDRKIWVKDEAGGRSTSYRLRH